MHFLCNNLHFIVRIKKNAQTYVEKVHIYMNMYVHTQNKTYSNIITKQGKYLSSAQSAVFNYHTTMMIIIIVVVPNHDVCAVLYIPGITEIFVYKVNFRGKIQDI